MLLARESEPGQGKAYIAHWRSYLSVPFGYHVRCASG